MLAYIIRRTLYVIPVVFGVALVTFVLFNVVGVDPAMQMLGRHASKDEIQALRHELGLDLPHWVNPDAARTEGWAGFFKSQWFFYCKQIVRFDFGRSFASQQKISTLMLNGMFPSLVLAAPIFFIEAFVSICIALFAAYYRNTWIDRSLVVLCVVGMSVSYLVYILVGQYVLAYRMQLFPIWGFESVKYLFLPVLVGLVSGIGGEVRFYRTGMVDEMYQDYVRAACSKGCRQKTVLFKHVLKNAMIPVITHTVIVIPFLFTGNLLLETFFGIPGIGYLTVEAINSNDIPVIKATVMVGSIIYVFASLLTDICYAMVDPRVKLR
jgi:peptide/nickel transport system permease protein